MKRKLSLQNMYGMRLVFQISEVANFLGVFSRSVRRWLSAPPLHQHRSRYFVIWQCRKPGFEPRLPGNGVTRVKPSENSDVKRIKTRRKARRTPARYAKQENGTQKCSTHRRCCEPGNFTTQDLVGHHERSQRIFRASHQGRPGKAALRSCEAGKRTSGRSGWNC